MTTDALSIPPSEDPVPEGDATVSPSPWEPWQQAGWNPAEVNPYEARQAYEGWQALGNRDTRGYMLERMLQGNELPEGMSWPEAQEIIQQAHQQRQDPFAQYAPEPAYGQEQQYGQEPDYGVQQPGVDPYQLRQAWQADMQTQISQFQEQMQRETSERQQVEEFGRGLDGIRSQHGLSESDMTFLAPRAAEYAQNGTQINQAVEQAYRDFDEWRRNALSSMGQQQGQSPQNFASQGGLAASPEQPPRSLSDARAFMESQTRR